MLYHSQPRLDRSKHVLDMKVYDESQKDKPVPVMPPSLLKQFAETLESVENAHSVTSQAYDGNREFTPYFFANDALEHFMKHYDEQTLLQEEAYLTDPGKFSLAGKLKSLPWRLTLLLHNWNLGASNTDEGSWSRRLPLNIVACSLEIFRYLYDSSDCLSPSCNLLDFAKGAGLLETMTASYPLLVAYLEKGSRCLPPPCAASGVAASSVPPLGFEHWWAALSPQRKQYAMLGAHWLMGVNRTATVGCKQLDTSLQGMLHDSKLTQQDRRVHVRDAMKLLDHACLATYDTSKDVVHKLGLPENEADKLAFANVFHLFSSFQL
eukprot:1434255-Lingulodinium_polyedra.AAC.1